jgi:hypothetical protein
MGNSKNVNHINQVMNDDVAEQTNVATEKNALAKLGINTGYIYMEQDAYIGNPDNLLGQVYMAKTIDGKVPSSLNDSNVIFEPCPIPIMGRKVDESSRLKEPILRQSIIVDKKLSASVSFLSYLSAELTANDYFSLMVYDQATGVVNMQDVSWKDGLKQWKEDHSDLMQDQNIHCLFVISAFSQKNVIRKKYVKYDGKTKGGYFGVNINGELSTSTEEYSLDIRFGLQPMIIKPFPSVLPRVAGRTNNIQMLQNKNMPFETKMSDKIAYSPAFTQKQLFGALSGKKLGKLI